MEWRTIPGTDGRYQASKCGQIRGPKTILKTRDNGRGYRVIDIRDLTTGKNRTHKVHALVLEAWIGPRPEGCDLARHIDGDRSNNAIENLAWGTLSENRVDMIAHGTTVRLLTGDQAREIVALEDRMTVKDISSLYGVSTSVISGILYGQSYSRETGRVYRARRTKRQRETSAESSL